MRTDVSTLVMEAAGSS